MNRRKAMKLTAGVMAGGGLGLLALTKFFKPLTHLNEGPQKLNFEQPESEWKYGRLDPAVTAGLAYGFFSEGSCMYATVRSIIAQLADHIGGPYTSFPYHLFKYGHGGVGGYGTICGALNGAAAIIGLLIKDKTIQDSMIADIFRWYENEPLPDYKPSTPVFDFSPPSSISNSVLCHASNTTWSNVTGYKVDSNERKERCRRLTGNVAAKLTANLNGIYDNVYMTNTQSSETVMSCVTCHGSEGKVNNTASKMSCNSCHSESVGHRIFSDVHYKLMKEE